MTKTKQYLTNLFKNEEVIFIKDSKLYILEDENKRQFTNYAKKTIKERFQLNLKKGLHTNGQLIIPPRLSTHIHIVHKKGVEDIINNIPLENILNWR